MSHACRPVGPHARTHPKVFRTAGILLAAAVLGGCATSGPPGGGINDPYETTNREVHAFNKDFDRRVFRPVSQAYGFVFPRYVRDKVNNFSHNLDLPKEIINNLLQGRPGEATHNFFRFLTNTTLGLAGVFDPASAFGVDRRETDFGETMFIWGVGEGAYLELPVWGPSTQRDISGEVVDLFLNPLGFIALSAPESFIPPAAFVLEVTDFRFEFTDTVDQTLYESADSYAQLRLFYLENRRFELGDTEASGGVIDPFDELFGE